MALRLTLVAALLGRAATSGTAANDANLMLNLRSEQTAETGRWQWVPQIAVSQWLANETCLVLIDVWDRHWCPTATERVGALAVLINATAAAARKRGVLVIHAPSDCMAYYSSWPQRQWVLSLPNATLPADHAHPDPLFPLDASDGGCDVGGAQPYKAWRRQNPLITIASEDAISAGPDGHQTAQELYNILTARGIKNVLYAGVHENMCIMNRPFAIKQVVRWEKFRVALVRELVDVMYNPLLPPYVSHERGVEMMTSFIEKFWAPSVSMYDLLNPRSRLGDEAHEFWEDYRARANTRWGSARLAVQHRCPPQESVSGRPCRLESNFMCPCDH